MSATNLPLTFRTIAYDGTNSSEVLALCELKTNVTDWAIASESGGVLVLSFDQSGPDSITVNTGDHVVFISHLLQVAVWPPAVYDDYFGQELPPSPDLTLSTGYALTPTIIASGSQVVAVQISPVQPSSAYQARAVLAGASNLLTNLNITSVAVADSDTVNVTVANSGLLSLAGATIIVTAASLE